MSAGPTVMRMTAASSPEITALRWGTVKVEGLGAFRDAKLWPGGGRAWDWRETGTHHVPGIQPADVAELLEHQPDAVVLSRGQRERLRTSDATHALLAESGIEIVSAETGAAVARYNELAAVGRPVAALIHSTC